MENERVDFKKKLNIERKKVTTLTENLNKLKDEVEKTKG
jgi:hypothetical protein